MVSMAMLQTLKEVLELPLGPSETMSDLRTDVSRGASSWVVAA